MRGVRSFCSFLSHGSPPNVTMPFVRKDGTKKLKARKLSLGKKYCQHGTIVGKKELNAKKQKALKRKEEEARKIAKGVRRKRHKNAKRDNSSLNHEQQSPPSSP